MTLHWSPQLAALVILAGAGTWLLAIGLFMALRPRQSLDLLRRTAATHRINLTEQGLRLLAGVALIIRAPLSKFPHAFEIGGWFIAISSIALLLIPLRLHAGYAIWWSNMIPLLAVRFIGPLSIGAGIALIWSAI